MQISFKLRARGLLVKTYPGGRGRRARVDAVLLKGTVAIKMSDQALGRGGGPTEIVRHFDDWC